MSGKENIVLVGGGGHARACLDVIQSNGKYTILGYLDTHETLDPVFNVPYLGKDDMMESFVSKASFLVTVGQLESAQIRIKLFEKLQFLNASFATVIAPSAIVSSYATIGEGSIVMHGAVIQASAVIGDNCIVNDKALIEHDCKVGNHVHISTGSILNGDVCIGNASFVGSGAVIKNGITIGKQSVIGAGTVIIKPVGEGQKWVGNPARQLSK